jgi:outer membrane phospholipase A
MKRFWIGAVGLILVNLLHAAPEALLVPPVDAAHAGKVLRISLFLNNPSTESTEFLLPIPMQAELVSKYEQRTVPVLPVGTPSGSAIPLEPMSFARVEMTIMLPDTLEGNVSLRITDPESNAIMFTVTPAVAVRATPGAVKAAEAAVSEKPKDLDLTSEHEKLRGHISGYDPIYFAVGSNERTNAKFQFSFKYRFFGPSGNIPEWWRELYFGYTQTSLWNLSDPSLPFYDTSYKPALFYLRQSFATKPDWLTRLGLQAGVQHESNGSAGDVSRSLNTVFVTPMFTRAISRKWSVTVAPRFLAYLEKSENPRIADYRGNVDLMIRVGASQGVEFTTYLRKGNRGSFGSMEFDFSLPLRKLPGVPPTVGGNLLLQYFNGWGESLRDYDVRRADQVRAGIMLIR